MKSKQHDKTAFIATTVVIILAIGALAFQYTVISSAALYVDMVDRREWRLQAQLNAESCASLAAIMAAKDYFLEGETKIDSFGCVAYVARDHSARTATIDAQARFSGISSDHIVKIVVVE